MRIRKNQKFGIWNSGGFTMVELLSALVILSIGLLAIFTAITGARDTQQRTLYMANARYIGNSIIEQYRSLKFDQLNQVATSQTSTMLPSGNSITCSYAKYPNATVNNLFLVTVQVSWTEDKGTRTVKYETLLYKP